MKKIERDIYIDEYNGYIVASKTHCIVSQKDLDELEQQYDIYEQRMTNGAKLVSQLEKEIEDLNKTLDKVINEYQTLEDKYYTEKWGKTRNRLLEDTGSPYDCSIKRG